MRRQIADKLAVVSGIRRHFQPVFADSAKFSGLNSKNKLPYGFSDSPTTTECRMMALDEINNIGKQSWILQIFYPTNKNKLYIFFVETRWGINLDMHSWT